MTVTINDKEYDETKFDDNTRNSIFQVQNSQAAITRLKAEILNHQILITHHNQVVRDAVEPETESPAEPEAKYGAPLKVKGSMKS